LNADFLQSAAKLMHGEACGIRHCAVDLKFGSAQRHGANHAVPYLEIELRQDLIASREGARRPRRRASGVVEARAQVPREAEAAGQNATRRTAKTAHRKDLIRSLHFPFFRRTRGLPLTRRAP
jgi:hypothetical protein